MLISAKILQKLRRRYKVISYFFKYLLFSIFIYLLYPFKKIEQMKNYKRARIFSFFF